MKDAISAVAEKIRKFLPRKISDRLPKKILVKKISARNSLLLNRRYRKKRNPANVLSFRYGKDYGEILACPAVVRKEAKKQGNSTAKQMTWMILHGMLHLSGSHHEKSARNATRFVALENAILSKIFKNTRD